MIDALFDMSFRWILLATPGPPPHKASPRFPIPPFTLSWYWHQASDWLSCFASDTFSRHHFISTNVPVDIYFCCFIIIARHATACFCYFHGLYIHIIDIIFDIVYIVLPISFFGYYFLRLQNKMSRLFISIGIISPATILKSSFLCAAMPFSHNVHYYGDHVTRNFMITVGSAVNDIISRRQKKMMKYLRQHAAIHNIGHWLFLTSLRLQNYYLM